MIFFFSGTGNTQWAARMLAKSLGEEAVDMAECMPPAYPTSRAPGGKRLNSTLSIKLKQGESLGFAFPVHAWGLPRFVADFLSHFPFPPTAKQAYTYFLCTCGDDMGCTLAVARKEFSRNGLHLDAAFHLIMPNSYVSLPGFDVDPLAVRKAKLQAAPAHLSRIAQIIKSRTKNHYDVKPGTFPRLKTYIIRPLFNRLLLTDKPFHHTASCTGCGVCAKVCPVANISLSSGYPQWLRHCTGCLACYHSCPTHALEYGKRTHGKGQYLCKEPLTNI